ncbi:MAG: hypothetical protein PF542_04820 [Nanoarchaeota archaeon]|jgi:hypothetical protein|nr:hypothetical protein [Nanoarchaeota archaeon]
MLENRSSNFKTLVLLRITKKLIENTTSFGIYRLEQILKEKSEEKLKHIENTRPLTKEEVKTNIQKEVKEKLSEDKYSLIPSARTREDIINNNPNRMIQKRKTPTPPQKRQQQRPQIQRAPREIQQRPIKTQSELPEHLRYLQPTKETTQPKILNIGTLTPFIQDRNVKTIETPGENEDVFVTGTMGKKPTGIKLTKEGIDDIISTFSQIAKIPKSEGLFKVTIGNIQFTAMISTTISSRFIIKKI